MKMINKIMIICALLAFQANSASPIDCDDISKPVEDVLRVRNEDQNLEERLKNVRDNLDEFMQIEREISTRLKQLACCATFFIQYDFEGYVRRSTRLGIDPVVWYDQVLRRKLTQFVNAEDCLRRCAEGRFLDIVSAQKRLHDSDGDSVLPPIQVECDLQGNDLYGNLQIFINRQKEIKDWEERQSRKKESLQISVFGVLCDQTAEATLGDKFSYIQALKQSLLRDFVDFQNERRTMIDALLAFSMR